ncbi:MAG: metallophosphoesterase [Pirellulales bacterium]
MKRIAHISDLHFGTEDPRIAAGLAADLAAISPNLLVVSGDLTQRAKEAEFRAAREFLDRIAAPRLVVPGNHDIPFYRVFERFLSPLRGYRHWIDEAVDPFFVDDETAVVGINTARSNTWKEGRVSAEQVQLIAERFAGAPATSHKILVAHHPFIPPLYHPDAAVVGRVEETLRTLERTGCGLILSGHLHRAASGDVRAHHLQITRSILAIQAGTSISQRTRGEANAYNHLRLEGDLLELEVRTWNGDVFDSVGLQTFRHGPHGWESKSPR